MTRLSTVGMVLLGAMVLSKYIVSLDKSDFTSGERIVRSVNKSSEQNDRMVAYLDLNKINKPKTTFLFADISSSIDKTNIPQQNIAEDNAPQNLIYDELTESAEEIFEENNDETEVAPMEQGFSSVVFPMIINPTETIKQKSERGNFPLDHGSTISSSMDRIFPRSQ